MREFSLLPGNQIVLIEKRAQLLASLDAILCADAIRGHLHSVEGVALLNGRVRVAIYLKPVARKKKNGCFHCFGCLQMEIERPGGRGGRSHKKKGMCRQDQEKEREPNRSPTPSSK